MGEADKEGSMTLYKVTVEYVVYVMADSEESACDVAERNLGSEDPDLISADQVKAPDSIAYGWKNAIPYGKKKDDKTVGQLITEMKETK